MGRKLVADQKGVDWGAKRDADETARTVGFEQSAQEARGEKRSFGSPPELSPGYRRIVVRVFDLPDPDKEYEELEVALREAQPSPVVALEMAEDNARRAHRLYVCARAAAEQFNIEASMIEAAMRADALAAITRDKASGHHNKAITEADVTGRMATMFHDEFIDLADRRIKSRKMVEHLEAFAQLWRSRCYSLSTIVGSRR